MEFVLGGILIVIGLLIAWGGFSGNLPGMIKALA
jgi:hypothetical protein